MTALKTYMLILGSSIRYGSSAMVFEKQILFGGARSLGSSVELGGKNF